MTVTGADAVAATFYRAPKEVREEVVKTLEKVSGLILQDQKTNVRKDTFNLEKGLTVLIKNDGLTIFIGYPFANHNTDYFYGRFYNDGTKGGVVSYRRNREGSSTNRDKRGRFSRGSGSEYHTMTVNPIPADHWMDRSLDANKEVLKQEISQAVKRGLANANR